MKKVIYICKCFCLFHSLDIFYSDREQANMNTSNKARHIVKHCNHNKTVNAPACSKSLDIFRVSYIIFILNIFTLPIFFRIISVRNPKQTPSRKPSAGVPSFKCKIKQDYKNAHENKKYAAGFWFRFRYLFRFRELQVEMEFTLPSHMNRLKERDVW